MCVRRRLSGRDEVRACHAFRQGSLRVRGAKAGDGIQDVEVRSKDRRRPRSGAEADPLLALGIVDLAQGAVHPIRGDGAGRTRVEAGYRWVEHTVFGRREH